MVVIHPTVVKGSFVGHVFWIDQNAFATALVEKVFQKKNIPFYSFKDLENLSYLIDDLKPSVIVLDSETALSQLEKLKCIYTSSGDFRGVPVVFLNSRPELSFISNRLGDIQKPFEPFRMPETLQNLLDLH